MLNRSPFIRTSLLMIMIISLVLGGSLPAYAQANSVFKQTSLERLQEKGIIKGNQTDKQLSPLSMTTASAVTLLVRAFDLNLNHIKFVKEPKASDYYTKVKDNTWYSKPFLVAKLNGIDIADDISPSTIITKEQFSHWLYQSLIKNEDYAWIEPFILISDADSIQKSSMDSIQKLLIADIAQLDQLQRFNPLQEMTYGSTAKLLDQALQFRDKQHSNEPGTSGASDAVSITIEEVDKDIRLVTLSATAPHPGYGIEISNIRFEGKQAIISYRILTPDPDRMYPQVMTTIKATTYIGKAYEPVLDTNPGNPKLKLNPTI